MKVIIEIGLHREELQPNLIVDSSLRRSQIEGNNRI